MAKRNDRRMKGGNVNIYRGIVCLQIILLIDLLCSIVGYSSQSLSVVRYLFYGYSSFLIILGLIRQRTKASTIQWLYLLWIIIILFRAIPTLFDDYQNHLYFKQFISGEFVKYLIPFLMLVEVDEDFLKNLIKLSFILVCVFLGVWVINLPSNFSFGNSYAERMTLLLGGNILLLMSYPYLSKRKQNITFLVTLLIIFNMMFLARRNKVLYFGASLCVSIIINSFNRLSDRTKSKRNAVLICVFGVVVFFVSMNQFSLFFERLATGMESREIVIDLFMEDVFSTDTDWLYGRGMYGQYYGGVNGDEITGLRDRIENGYLQLILKGGWIWLGLLILNSIRTLYLGFFKSNNSFCKCMASIILIYFIDMIGMGVPGTSLKYIMIFIAMACCNSVWLRSCSDEEISKILKI